MKPQAARRDESRGIQKTSGVPSPSFFRIAHKSSCSPMDAAVVALLSIIYLAVVAMRRICTSAVPMLSKSMLGSLIVLAGRIELCMLTWLSIRRNSLSRAELIL